MTEYQVFDEIRKQIKRIEDHGMRATDTPNGLSVGDYLVTLHQSLAEANTAWCDNPTRRQALAEIRLLAAAAVMCLREHGEPSDDD
jgi:hypothetical protein